MDTLAFALRGPTRWVASRLIPYQYIPPIDGIPAQTPPAPRPRRTLSIPPTSSGAYLQTQSPLFALPTEIRTQILSYGLSHLTIPLFVSASGHLKVDRDFPLSVPLRARRILSVLLTCRRVYVEAIPLLYATCEIRTFDPQVVMFLPAVMPVQRFRRMRLVFTWNLSEAPRISEDNKIYRKLNEAWVEVWRALARMKGLQMLRVNVEAEMGRWYQWCDREAELLETIRDAGDWSVGNFEVVVNWPRKPEYGEGMPGMVLPCRFLSRGEDVYI